MKIVNKKKFIKTIVIVIVLLFLLCLIINNTYSKAKISYKEDYIIKGDTLWSIAVHEVNTNEYYKGKDVRKVMYEIKKINNLESNNLTIGQKIKIPSI